MKGAEIRVRALAEYVAYALPLTICLSVLAKMDIPEIRSPAVRHSKVSSVCGGGSRKLLSASNK